MYEYFFCSKTDGPKWGNASAVGKMTPFLDDRIISRASIYPQYAFCTRFPCSSRYFTAPHRAAALPGSPGHDKDGIYFTVHFLAKPFPCSPTSPTSKIEPALTNNSSCSCPEMESGDGDRVRQIIALNIEHTSAPKSHFRAEKKKKRNDEKQPRPPQRSGPTQNGNHQQKNN